MTNQKESRGIKLELEIIKTKELPKPLIYQFKMNFEIHSIDFSQCGFWYFYLQKKFDF